MEDGESQIKGHPVTKVGKVGLQSKKEAADQPNDTVEGDAYRMSLRQTAEVPNLAISRAKKAAPKPEMAEQIGQHLRSVYDEVLAQPVPDRFLELLRQLESKPGARPKKEST